MAKKGYNIDPVTLRSMPFWCVGNPLGDPFGGAVLPKIDSLDVAKLLAAAAGELATVKGLTGWPSGEAESAARACFAAAMASSTGS